MSRFPSLIVPDRLSHFPGDWVGRGFIQIVKYLKWEKKNVYVGLCFWNVSQIQRSKVNRAQNGSKEVLVGEGSAEKGLSQLVQQVLGRPLDKTEQMSNWKRRPLRASQIRYAGEPRPRASLLTADNDMLTNTFPPSSGRRLLFAGGVYSPEEQPSTLWAS